MACPLFVLHPQVSTDLIRTMRELGVARALSCALRFVISSSASHPLSGATVSAILKPLEVLTRNMANWAAGIKAATAAASLSMPLAAGAQPTDGAGLVTAAGSQPANLANAAEGSAAASSGDAAAVMPAASVPHRSNRSNRRGNHSASVQRMIRDIDDLMEGLAGDSDDGEGVVVEGDSDADMGDDDDDDDDDGEEGEDDEDEGEDDDDDVMDGDDDDDIVDGDALELQLPDGQIITVIPGPDGELHVPAEGEPAMIWLDSVCLDDP